MKKVLYTAILASAMFAVSCCNTASSDTSGCPMRKECTEAKDTSCCMAKKDTVAVASEVKDADHAHGADCQH